MGILYSANRTSRNDVGYEALYASPDRTITLNLHDSDILAGNQRTLARFALWPYDGNGGTDRLTILQNVVARELDDSNQPHSSVDFSARLENLLNEARWNHRTFIDKQIDQHFVQLQSAKDYVAETTKKVADTVDTVARSLTETLLGTVGIVVATLLAALAKPQDEGRIIGTTMRLYALFLFIQAVLRLGSALHSFILLRHETTARLEDLRLVLGKRNIATISKPLVGRWCQFSIWFTLTLALFILLGIGVLIWVPDFVRETVPRPSPTPTIVTTTPRP